MISKADSGYSAETTFLVTTGDLNYRFKFKYTDLSSGQPQGYRFQDDVINEVIWETAKGLNISFAASFDSFLADFILDALSGVINNIYAIFRNALIVDNQALVDWGLIDNVHYAWTYEFTGSDPNYPGHAIYGTAYGFRFTGACFETVDLVLDSNGNLYGSNPIGNFTLNQTTEDLINDQIGNQKDITGEWAIPNIDTTVRDGIPPAYFVGNDLHFFGMTSGSQTPLEYIITNCADTSIQVYRTPQNQGFLSLMPLDDTWNNSQIIFPGNQSDNFTIGNNRLYENWRSYLPNSVSGSHSTYVYQFFNNYVHMNFNLPNFYFLSTNLSTVTQNNSLGFIDNISIEGFADCYLSTVSLTPAPDFPEVPTGDPIPIGDIPDDPTEYDPDPGSDPDPVPGIDYPSPDVPDPTIPDIPGIVSGNDELWPDVNIIFDFENDLDGFLGPLFDFEFPDFNTVISNFVGPLTWISGIMTLLFEGSELNVLFTVIAILFIASALLGIYKWWK